MAKDFDYYFAQLRKIEDHRTKTAEVELRRMYKRLLKSTKEFLADEYYQLAQDGKLTYEILRAHSRDARLLAEVEQRLNGLSSSVSQEITSVVQEMYQTAYNGMVEAVQKSATNEELAKRLQGLRGVSPETIKAAVENPVSGLTLSDTLEKNRKDIIWNIKREIGVGLTHGDRYETMAKRIATSLDSDYKKAIRIVRTEAHRVRESGHLESAKQINNTLDQGETDERLTKTWITMEDGVVRPQISYKTKKGWVKGKPKAGAPDHVKMHKVTVAMEDPFDLGMGVTAMAPGQSGVAGHDINCRCFVKYQLMDSAEFEKAAGKPRPASAKQKQVAKYEQQEQDIIDEKASTAAEMTSYKKDMADLEQGQYVNIWKNPVTVKDYEALQGKVQAKRDYFNDQLAKDGSSKWVSLLADLDDFEMNGQNYLKLKNKLEAATARVKVLDDDLKDVRLKLMKAKGIDLDKIKAEIADLKSQLDDATVSPLAKITFKAKDGTIYTAEQYVNDKSVKKAIEESYEWAKDLAQEKVDWGIPIPKSVQQHLDDYKALQDEIKLAKASMGKKVTIKTKVKNVDPDTIKAAFHDAFPNGYTDTEIDSIINVFKDDSIKEMIEYEFLKDDQDLFKNSLKKVAKQVATPEPDNAADIVKLKAAIKAKEDELEAVMKRYGLEDDKFSKARKDAAHWFTDDNGGAKAADGAYRAKAGEVWRNATEAEKDWIYEYTRSYSKYNEPLRGIDYGTNKYLGVGNVDMDMIGVSYRGFKKGEIKKQINEITSIIDKSSYDFDLWVNRGCQRSGMDKFFGIDISDFDLPEDELAAKLVGTTPTEYGFMSTGVAKGKGFGGEFKLNIYAPAGTKMMYVEPISAFGSGSGRSWDGVSPQRSIGYEAEMLFQRGTTFRVIKVEKTSGTIYVDLEVISQEAKPF